MDDVSYLDESTVLVLSLDAYEKPIDICPTFLNSIDCRTLVIVGVTQSVDYLLSTMTSVNGINPDSIWLVAVGKEAQSVSTDGTIRYSRQDPTITLKTVTDPSNLSQLGVALTECFQAVSQPRNERNTALCFGAVSPFFQHAEFKTAFEFFHILTGHVRSHGINAHFHVNQSRMSDRDYHLLRQLMDVVIEVDENRKWTINSVNEYI